MLLYVLEILIELNQENVEPLTTKYGTLSQNDSPKL